MTGGTSPAGTVDEAVAGILATQGTPGRRLRVLVLDESYPQPNGGKPIRTRALLTRLGARHDITFLCHGPQEREFSDGAMQVIAVRGLPEDRGVPLYLRLLGNLFSRYPYSVAKHHTAAMRTRLAALLGAGNFDLVQVEWTPYARYVERGVRLPVVVVAHNVESQIWERRSATASSAPARFYFGIQAGRMARFEQQVARRAEWVTAVSDADAAIFRSWGARAVSLVENGVDLEEFAPRERGLEHDGEMLYIGALDWYANQHAVLRFLDRILPLVQRARPGARLRVVGRRPPAEFARRVAAAPGVEMVGEVADVRPELARAAVVVVPLEIGGGTRLKILEALAMSKAIVSTTVGAEGLDLTAGQHLRIADAPDSFAAAVIALLDARDERERLGRQGCERVRQRYGWEHAAAALEQVWLAVARASQGRGNAGAHPPSPGQQLRRRTGTADPPLCRA